MDVDETHLVPELEQTRGKVDRHAKDLPRVPGRKGWVWRVSRS